MGLFLRNPAYHEKAPEFMINMQVIIFLVMLPFFFGLIAIDQFVYDYFGIIDSFYFGAAFVVLTTWIFGLLMLIIGAKHLNSLE
jgi:hypothetical protein